MNSPYEPAEPTNTPDGDQTGLAASGLDWQAWLYIAGELDDAARDAFETRLLEDVAACEAVARAVELSDLLAAARPALVEATAIPVAISPQLGVRSTAEVVPAANAHSAGNWSQRVGWMALGAAASLAVMLSGRVWRQGGFSGPGTIVDNEQVASATDDARTLAVVWTELWNMDDTLSLAESDDDSIDRADSVLARSSRDDEDSAPPDWLLAAVADDETEGDLPAPPQPN